MSFESVQTIIGRALVDQKYRDQLLNEPEEALAGYELSMEETTALKRIPQEQFDNLAAEVEERTSKAGLIGGTSLLACDGSTKGSIELTRLIIDAFFRRM